MNIERSDTLSIEDPDYVQIYVNGETHTIVGNDVLKSEDVRVEIHGTEEVDLDG